MGQAAEKSIAFLVAALAVVLVVALTSAAYAAQPQVTFKAGKQVYRVVDADTIALVKQNIPGGGSQTFSSQQRFRIRGFDAPEERASKCATAEARAREVVLGRSARRALELLVTAPNRRITIRRYQKQRDAYGRELVQMWVNGKTVSALMIRAGHGKAWDGVGPKPNWCE